MSEFFHHAPMPSPGPGPPVVRYIIFSGPALTETFLRIITWGGGPSSGIWLIITGLAVTGPESGGGGSGELFSAHTAQGRENRLIRTRVRIDFIFLLLVNYLSGISPRRGSPIDLLGQQRCRPQRLGQVASNGLLYAEQKHIIGVGLRGRLHRRGVMASEESGS